MQEFLESVNYLPMQNFSFESAMEQLQVTIKRLESGELSLEQSLESFETGIKLCRICQEHLATAEQKIEVLMKATSENQAQGTSSSACLTSETLAVRGKTGVLGPNRTADVAGTTRAVGATEIIGTTRDAANHTINPTQVTGITGGTEVTLPKRS